MNHQLAIFDAVGDRDLVSPANTIGDTKIQAIEQYCNRAKVESTAYVKTYKPNGRKTEYFRLDYRVGKKVKSIHIKGGNIRAELAQYRAKKPKDMIFRAVQS